MTTPLENNPSDLARNRLAKACHNIDRNARINWTLTISQVVLLAVLVLALVDYWLMLPFAVRTLGALGVVSLVLLGVFRLVRLLMRPTRLKPGALRLEAEQPELGCEISTAAEYLTGERKVQHAYEPELVAALETRAASNLAVRLAQRSDFLPRAFLVAATLLGLVLLIPLLPMILTALQHATLPFSRAQYTKVDVVPGNLEIAVGKSLNLTNRFSGRAPRDPRLHWRSADGAQWQSVALAAGTNGSYGFTFTNLQSDLVYRVTGNDAVSPEFRISTYVPPEVKDLTIQITYPDYTRLPPATQKTPDITAVRASIAGLRLVGSVELSAAKLRFSNAPELALTKGPDGTWSESFPITKDADYWVDLVDLKGHLGGNEKPFHIKALPDRPPAVEITEPGKDIRANLTNKVLVKISASDDFGVGEVKLKFNKLGGPEREITAPRESQQNGEVRASAEIDLATLDLKEYEVVAYHAEATDNNTLDGPGVGRSQVFFIEVTNEEAPACKLTQGQSQRLNLLVIQKQIIADTTALAPKAPKQPFDDLATRQKDARDFGQMYLDALTQGGAPDAAVKEMNAALDDMKTASAALAEQKRAQAIPPEEGALAHMYQVLKLLPEMQNFPTSPETANQPPPDPKVQVVLEAIKQKKKEPADNQELQAALDQAKELLRSQSGLNSAIRKSEEAVGADSNSNSKASQSTSQAASQSPGQSSGQSPQQSESQAAGQAASGQGQPSQAQANGQGDGNEPSKDQNSDDPKSGADSKPSPAQMAGKESQLSKAAVELAEKLKRLAGKDSRVGHNAGRNATRASANLSAAGQALSQGSFGQAGEYGFQGEMSLQSIVSQLERALKNQPEPSDVANEDYPKEYESLISEYLKKLSHAE
jgi:hypothetical protein